MSIADRIANAHADRGIAGVVRVCTSAVLNCDPALTPEQVAVEMHAAAQALCVATETLLEKVRAPSR